MKKSLLAVIFAFLMPVFLFAQVEESIGVPQNLEGIWEGVDRIVFLENDDENKPHLTVILKDYYGWYYDRVLEDEDYSKKEPRVRNTATSKKAGSAVISFSGTLFNEMIISYAKRDVRNISYRLIDDRMYFNFWDIIPLENATFYRGKIECEGILASYKNTKSEFVSYVKHDDGTVYRLRYWKTKMDYDSEAKAEIKHSDDEYIYVPKMLVSEGITYTCATGRRTVVRNQEIVSSLFDGLPVIYDSESSFAALDNLYYIQLADKKTFEELMQIVKEANSRRKPDPKPLFPDAELDYHWDLIDYLESGNDLIKAVRQRQKDFGIRGKDIGK